MTLATELLGPHRRIGIVAFISVLRNSSVASHAHHTVRALHAQHLVAKAEQF